MELLLILSIILLKANIIKFHLILRASLAISLYSVWYVAILTYLFLDMLKSIMKMEIKLYCLFADSHVFRMRSVTTLHGIPKHGSP